MPICTATSMGFGSAQAAQARLFGHALRQERPQVTQLPRMASECIRLLILTVHDIVMRFPAGDETPDDKVGAASCTTGGARRLLIKRARPRYAARRVAPRQRVTPALRDCFKAALTDSVTAFADALHVLAEDVALGAALPHTVADADLVHPRARGTWLLPCMSDVLLRPPRRDLLRQRRLRVLSNVSYTNEALVPSLATLASTVARSPLSAHVRFAAPSAYEACCPSDTAADGLSSSAARCSAAARAAGHARGPAGGDGRAGAPARRRARAGAGHAVARHGLAHARQTLRSAARRDGKIG